MTLRKLIYLVGFALIFYFLIYLPINYEVFYDDRGLHNLLILIMLAIPYLILVRLSHRFAGYEEKISLKQLIYIAIYLAIFRFIGMVFCSVLEHRLDDVQTLMLFSTLATSYMILEQVIGSAYYKKLDYFLMFLPIMLYWMYPERVYTMTQPGGIVDTMVIGPGLAITSSGIYLLKPFLMEHNLSEVKARYILVITQQVVLWLIFLTVPLLPYFKGWWAK